jgi:hypothetical protein
MKKIALSLLIIAYASIPLSAHAMDTTSFRKYSFPIIEVAAGLALIYKSNETFVIETKATYSDGSSFQTKCNFSVLTVCMGAAFILEGALRLIEQFE